MPILVRPVREQLEHDRVIRHLQAKLKRKYDVTTNVGDEKNAGVRSGNLTLYPDLVLSTGRKIVGVIEVETTESVNHLEAMAQWAHFGRSRVNFQLYVPAATVEMARRLSEENQVAVSEIWSFHPIGDQMRFALMHRLATPPPVKATPAAKPAEARPARSTAPRPAARSKAAPSRGAAKRSTRPARRSAASTKKVAGRAQKRK